MLRHATKFQILVSFAIVIWVSGDQAGFWPSQLLQRLESITYDYRVQLTLDGEVDPGLVIIDIDERSIAELGQWPWPRSVIAELIDTLFAVHGMTLLGVDVVFSEPEQNQLRDSWPVLLEQFPDLPEEPPLMTGDEQLANVLASWPVVLGYYFAGLDPAYPDVLSSVGVLPPPLQLLDDDWQQLDIPWVRAERFTSNFELLQNAANSVGSGAGFFDNPVVDADGMIRRAPMVQQAANGQLYPALSLSMLLELLGNPPVQAIIETGAGVSQLEGFDVGGFLIPTDSRGIVQVPWYGPERHFNYVSAVDVLSGEVDSDLLAGSIGILGTSAPGLKDLRSTPVGAVFPGVEINISLLAGMLHQRFLSEPAYARAASTLLLVVLGSIISVAFPYLTAFRVLAAGLILMSVHILINTWMWNEGLLLAFAPVTVVLIGTTGLHLLGNYWRESQRTSQVTSLFGQYVPPELVSDMVRSDFETSLVGAEKELTVMFSDIRNFTAFSEQVSPSQLSEVMNRLLTPLTRAIHANRGTIDKYMGDAIMAFWGAPLADDAHADHALQSARDMQNALAQLNSEFKDEGLPALAMGIGVHTGPMNVGNMGSEFRMAYTVLGDNVNLGSRVEGLTKSYSLDVLTTDATVQQAPDWLFRPVDKVRVKGRRQPVMLYTPLCRRQEAGSAQKELTARTREAFDLYQDQKFALSLALWNALALDFPDDPVSKIYIERCQIFADDAPGEDWEGVWTHTSK
ncbi:CHASE2 domain-containing protein [Pseudohongiella spirulinae]|uniref:Adenylyl cyclase class-3/4/guanylyl cyclase n=1 Tax=Pseudohongiella spirulinae TaxID=1249552 RepID=A0A0S2KG85_9GAMM|nr:adenylate/guanylate cyclase domain-containing protein [Pseudohongiella spirulinae]ALO47344.1 Adenylyl cyclase class-3/4/guanylyl cyclase [Pseudohongiella spirulinae]